METVVGAFVGVMLLIVITWIAIFGGIGALLSRSREGTVLAGLVWGACLGPFGWAAILYLTREDPLPNVDPPAPVTYLSDSSPPAAPERWDPWNK